MAFGGYLKQNTAVDVLIGPFVDEDDGKTAETGLTLSQADIKLSKNGQALAQKHNANAATHDANGYYNCELDATDTNTIGQLVLIVHESGALPVRHEYQVLEESIYDALFASGASGFDADQRVDVGKWLGQAVTLSSGNKPDVNIEEISGDSTAADNLELEYQDNWNIHTWHVAKTGNDGNGGHSLADAFLTIAQAVSSASDGDTIIIHPGMYMETMDLSGKTGLTVIGMGLGSQIVKMSGGHGCIIGGDRTTLKNLSIVAAGDGYDAIYNSGKNYIFIDGCLVSSTYEQGIRFINCGHARITNTVCYGREYGLYVNIEDDTESSTTNIDNCKLVTDGDWTTRSSAGLSLSGNVKATVSNSILVGKLNDTHEGYVAAGLYMQGEAGEHADAVFNNCVLYGWIGDGGGSASNPSCCAAYLSAIDESSVTFNGCALRFTPSCGVTLALGGPMKVFAPKNSIYNTKIYTGNPEILYTSPYADSAGRVDVSLIEGSDATDQIQTAADAALETVISDPTAGSVKDLVRFLAADKVIDTSGSPWVLELRDKDTKEVLLRQTMKNTSGESITNVNNVLGRLEKE